MLEELSIRNMAVVEDVNIRFGDGLNVLTGSTGAGKSIILAAVDLLSGARARRSLVRGGADVLRIEGIFSIPRGAPARERLGMDGGEESLSIRREVRAGGRSRIWINGILSTNANAADIIGSLVELHGQRRQQELLDQSTHIACLDGRGEYDELLRRVRLLVGRFEEARSRLRRLERDAEEHRSREDFMRFQLEEIEQLDLETGTAADLEGRIAILSNRHRYLELLGRVEALLEGSNGSILDLLGEVESALREIGELDGGWREETAEMANARITLREIARDVGRAAGDAEESNDDLEELQGRLAAIQRLERKHGLDCAGLVEKREELRRILGDIDGGSVSIEEARREVRLAVERLGPLLDELTGRRKETARTLDRAVTAELVELGMKGARFRTSIEPLENSALHGSPHDIHLTAEGRDRVEFLIRTNVGEEMHPLAEIASGGELSRVTLVLKSLQAAKRSIPTLVFDEIDSGLGADLGRVVAGRLRELARRYQVVVITHLPQVAASASRHVKIEKRVHEGRTRTTAVPLDARDRVGEIARMLGGPGELRERLAAEMLEETTRARSSAG